MRSTPVVNHLLRLGFREKADDLTPLKIQKLLYFLHGWYLAVTGKPLIEEGFEKWQYGPVARGVYDALKRYGSNPVDDYIKDFDWETGEETAHFINPETVPQFSDVLEAVWKKYSPLTGAQLSTLTHLEQTPWSLTEMRERIDDELIRKYFVDQANAKRNASAETPT
ncbi:Panacea domain-containing protein [Pseudoduganella violacea]|uniref:Putative phage-associated protein n=1 Tax=Pseudoduganella violacea TaxID=1715466 RepID=A0A7W5BD72_9BURK|nr:type II toxin-antitoxin system antitoxin SocA domain-containing protein [Pseudoduganella violacea]MBB3121006.1 putative phage-associated protein [Pseudoduganella violacea]